MLREKLHNIISFYTGKNRWWIPLLTGLPFFLTLPPFNHELHWVFAFFPFLSFISLIPLLFFSLQKPTGRAVLHTYLYSYTVALGQCFWVAFVKIEGLWGIIFTAMFLLAGYVALYYLAAGMIFRWCYRTFPRLYLVIFPAFWVLIDYSRTLGELNFPWEFLGYSLTPLLPLSQFASITGVWGLTFLIIIGNLFFWEICRAFYRNNNTLRRKIYAGSTFCLLISIITIGGWIRIKQLPRNNPTTTIAIIQPAIDQLRWGNYSLEESFTIVDSLIYRAAKNQPDFIIGPESALLCYLSRQGNHRRKFQQWADSTRIPILLGAIHWDKAPGGSIYDYLAYNTAFLAHPGQKELSLYRKMKLVPFSEAFPFEAKFPILSRVNLGEADFKRGTEETVFTVNQSIKAAPFVCYEIIFPGFVQHRLKKDANLIVHITNDGWFGKTTGPYQHATMSRMRAIENRVSIARCAITGISMFIDPVGRVIKQTKLDQRTIIDESISLKRPDTLYFRFGDWFVFLCGIIGCAGIILFLVKVIKKPISITNRCR
jgi:apolipoprotein N-acyltransferase